MAFVNRNTKTNTRIVIGKDGLPRKDRFDDLINEIVNDPLRTHVVIVCETIYDKCRIFDYLIENLPGITKQHLARRWIETSTHRIETRVVYEREDFRGHRARTHKFILIGDDLHYEFKDSYLKELVAPLQ